jgi:ubiquinone/menaquinone biosynthesis C-methylase UbiE
VGAALTSAQVERARRRYRWLAPLYHYVTRRGWLEAARSRAVELLTLTPGDSVLDLGCGTGNSFPLIEARIGPSGRLIGVDASPHMLARAQQGVHDHGWRNVTLVQADAAALDLPERVDAVLCFCTHDILTSPAAVARAIARLTPGGRIVAAGAQRPESRVGWLLAPGLFVSGLVFATRRSGRDRPWRELERILPGMDLVETRRAGAFFLARGRAPTGPTV